MEHAEPSSLSANADLIDLHRQLRHEATALRLQLRTKQEVLERTARTCDELAEEVLQLQRTIEDLTRVNFEMQEKLEISQRRERQLQSHLHEMERVASTRILDGREDDDDDDDDDGKGPALEGRGDSASSEGGEESMATPEVKSNGDAGVDELHRKEDRRRFRDRLRLFEGSGDGSSLPLRIPSPLQDPSSRCPELASACKITMAARATDQPKSAREHRSDT